MDRSVGLPSSDPAAFAIDAQQRIVMWSPAAERLLHVEASQAVGVPCYQVFAAKDPFGRPLCRPGCSLCQGAETGKLALRHHLVVQSQKGPNLHLICDVVPLPPGPGPRAITLMRNARQRESGGLGTFSSLSPESGQAAGGWLGSILQYLGALGTISATPVSPDLNQALDKALSDILRVTGAEVAEIFLRAEQGREMVLTAHRGLFPSTFLQINRFSLGEGFPGLVAASGQAIVTSTLAQDTRYLRSKVKEKGFQFYMCVPLIAEQDTVGCVNIASRRQGEDIPSRLQFLSWVAPSLAASIQMGWLQGRDLVSNYEFEPLLDAELNLDQLLTHILEITMSIAQAEAGALALYEDATKTFKTRDVRGAFGEALCRAFSLGEASECPLVKENRTVLCYGPRYTWASVCRALSREVATAVCLPLRTNGDLVGAITLGQRKPDKLWTTRHLSILSAVSSRAALAMKNAQAYLGSRELVASDEEIPATMESYHPLKAPGQSSPESPGADSRLRLDIRCFGRFQLYLDGKLLSPRAFRRRQSLTALKILFTYRERPLTKEQLIEYLWPEGDPETAARNLPVVIHDLRRGLASISPHEYHFILAEGGSYHFNTQAPYRLDVDEFLKGVKWGEGQQAQGNRQEALEIYRSTARLYQGDFLEDESYNDWCSAERERLREIYLTLMEKIASLLAEEGDLEGSAGYLRQALLVDNLREMVYRQLMHCLWKAGRSDEALRQYTICKQVLAEELGVGPLKETENLYLLILKEREKGTKSKK